jgi:hypothetical protein
MTEKTATPAEITRWRKRIRQHLDEIEAESWQGDDPVGWDADDIDDVSLDKLAARILEDVTVMVRAAGEDTSRG